jgi:hypothetical protein
MKFCLWSFLVFQNIVFIMYIRLQTKLYSCYAYTFGMSGNFFFTIFRHSVQMLILSLFGQVSFPEQLVFLQKLCENGHFFIRQLTYLKIQVMYMSSSRAAEANWTFAPYNWAKRLIYAHQETQVVPSRAIGMGDVSHFPNSKRPIYQHIHSCGKQSHGCHFALPAQKNVQFANTN